MTKQPAIAVTDLSFSYGANRAVDKATFTIGKGDFLGVIGPNGGGKTTLLKLMLGLLKPETGAILIDGQPPETKRGKIGYIPQETNLNKLFPVSVRDVVLMGLTGVRGLMQRYSPKDHSRVDAMLEQFGLTAVSTRSIADLSGGQRQKVLLARALVSGPDLLMLDEPTASVDTSGEDEIYRYLQQINGNGVTIVLVTHNISVLSRYVKSVACINRSLYFHPEGTIDQETVNKTFGCEVDIIAHGVPHRVFHKHNGECRHG